MSVKQVIVMRRDLHMRRGKEIAQGSHAAMAFLVERMRGQGDSPTLTLDATLRSWLFEHCAKICVRVESEAELVEVFTRARAAGLPAHLIRDAGRTEFGGVPTLTCCAIGPADAAAIDAITGNLTLY